MDFPLLVAFRFGFPTCVVEHFQGLLATTPLVDRFILVSNRRHEIFPSLVNPRQPDMVWRDGAGLHSFPRLTYSEQKVHFDVQCLPALVDSNALHLNPFSGEVRVPNGLSSLRSVVDFSQFKCKMTLSWNRTIFLFVHSNIIVPTWFATDEFPISHYLTAMPLWQNLTSCFLCTPT